MGKKEDNKATKHIVNNFQGATIHNFVYNDHGTTNIYESVIAPSGEDRRATSPTETGEDDRLQDIMRKDAGINGDAQRIEQMVWMFFLTGQPLLDFINVSVQTVDIVNSLPRLRFN